MEAQRRKKSRRRRVGKQLRRFKFFRVLDEDRPFAVAFAVLGVVAILGGGAFLRLWRVTPTDFSGPEVRISLVEWLQVRSRVNAARRAEAVGDYARALFAWRSAEAINNGDPELYRGFLGYLAVAAEAPVEDGLLAISATTRLLGLTHTNLNDLRLAAEVLEKFGQPRSALEAFAAVREGSAETLAPVRARCLASAGDFRGFAKLWERHGARWEGVPELAPYHDAWVAVSGAGTTAAEAAARLQARLEQPGTPGILAARLLLEVAAQRSEVGWTESALARLQRARADSAPMHARLWRMLAAMGKAHEARERALAYRDLPAAPEDAAAYLTALRELAAPDLRGAADPRERAVQFAEENLPRYGRSASVWRAYLEVLIDLRRWNDVRRMTGKARTSSGQHEDLLVEAVLADFQSAVAARRGKETEGFAAELEGMSRMSPETSVRAAALLRAADRREIARALLARHGALGSPDEAVAEQARKLEAALEKEGAAAGDGTLAAPGPAEPPAAVTAGATKDR